VTNSHAFVVVVLAPLLLGSLTTIVVSFVAIAIGVFGGLNLGFALLSESLLVRGCCRAYVSIFRGTPLLVQLLVCYYFLPALLHINLSPLVASIAALALNTTAFQGEIYRGGLLAIPKGQIDAARMLGLSTFQARRTIVVPQLLKLVLPSLMNETISIVKNSSLISVVAVTELLRVSEGIVATTYRPAEVYGAAACIYFTINFSISLLGRAFDARLSRG
jgi:polar amino acid transport system permease protein